jgi:hypothetical protein
MTTEVERMLLAEPDIALSEIPRVDATQTSVPNGLPPSMQDLLSKRIVGTFHNYESTARGPPLRTPLSLHLLQTPHPNLRFLPPRIFPLNPLNPPSMLF